MPDMSPALSKPPHGAHHIAPDIHGKNFYAIDRQFQDLMALYAPPTSTRSTWSSAPVGKSGGHKTLTALKAKVRAVGVAARPIQRPVGRHAR